MFVSLAIIFLLMIPIVGYSLSERNQVSLRQYLMLMRIIWLMILFWLLFFEPKNFIRWDLLEHYDELSNLRSNDFQYALNYGEYKGLPIANIYFFLISRMKDNRFFSVIPLFIDGCAFIYILKNSFQRERVVNFSHITFATILWWCTFGFKLSISGVRCVTAVAIVTVAIYKDAVKRERSLQVLLLYILPLMIHQFAIVPIVIRLFARVKHKSIGILAIPAIILFGPPVARFLGSLTSNYYLQEFVRLLTKYWDRFNIINWIARADSASITVYFAFVVVVLYLCYMVLEIKRNANVIDIGTETVAVLEALTIVAFGSLFNYLIIERLMYFIAYGLIICFSWYIQLHKRKSIIDYVVLVICLWLFFFNDIYIFLVNYTGVYFLAF